MKYGMLALVAGGLLLAGCGGSNSTNGGLDAQSKHLQRSIKTTTVAADYQDAVQSLYIAYFGRPADPAGLANFEAALAADNAPTTVAALAEAYSTNSKLKTLIDSFGTSTESQNLYGNAGSQAFVKAVFQHVLGRDPLTAGLNYWSGAIDSGSLSQGDAALAIMGGALTNTTAQGLLDAQLVHNRITAAEYFTTQVSVQLDTSAYTGATAASQARNMLSLVTASTDLTAFQAQENTAIAGLPNLPTITGTTSPYAGQTLYQFNLGTSVYDAAGNVFGVDASSYVAASLSNNTYLNGLIVYPSNSDFYVENQGNIIGYLDIVTSPSGTSEPGFYYIANNLMGRAQINTSATGWSIGCTGACVSNTSTSPTPVALQEIDTTVGTGAVAVFGKTATVTYTGWLYDVNAAGFKGTEFDSSSQHSGSFPFEIGAGNVIAGWDIGVQGMKVGGTRTLIIPSALAYRNQANGIIPANAGLVFTVTLLSVQ